MKPLGVLSCVLTFFAASPQLVSANFELIVNKNPAAAVIIPAGSSEKLKADVEYLNEALFRIAKVSLPVRKKSIKGEKKIIFDVCPMTLAEDDKFFIEFPNAETMKITCSKRSSRWAINFLLQKYCGVVPLWRREIYYPEASKVTIPIERVEQNSSFTLRRDFQNAYVTELFDGLNGKAEFPFVHSMVMDVFPAEKYAKNYTWPEVIMPVIKGKKVWPPKLKPGTFKDPARVKFQLRVQCNKKWNPCFSNPATLDIAVKNILEILAKNPDKKVINMDVNDGPNYCECPVCRKAVGNKVSVTGTGHRDYSSLYWGWVNKVAEQVTRKYPDVYFSGIAYREVVNPPGFKLHPNVVPVLCRDIYAAIDGKVAKTLDKWITAWQKDATQLGYYDYAYGTLFYLIPRIYYTHHANYMKYLYNHSFRSIYFESWPNEAAAEGPKFNIMMKLAWNINDNVEQIINEWCVAAVGPESAPYLREYYRFWENYWMGKDIRRTKWFQSKNATYLSLGEIAGSHTFALKKGDMEKCRRLMEKVVENAKGKDWKRRAKYIKMLFDLSYFATKALFSEIINPEGKLESQADALAMIKAAPAAVKAAEQLKYMPRAKFLCNGLELLPYLANNMGALIPFIKDKKVKTALINLAQDKSMPPLLKGSFKMWLGEPMNNLIKNGSFENDTGLPEGNFSHSKEYKYSGTRSIKMGNGRIKWRIPVEPTKTYLFAIRVFVPKNSAEGLFGFRLAPGFKAQNSTLYLQPLNRITAGTWNLFSAVMEIPGKRSYCPPSNRLDVLLMFSNFEPGESAYIDDMALICLDNI